MAKYEVTVDGQPRTIEVEYPTTQVRLNDGRVVVLEWGEMVPPYPAAVGVAVPLSDPSNVPDDGDAAELSFTVGGLGAIARAAVESRLPDMARMFGIRRRGEAGEASGGISPCEMAGATRSTTSTISPRPSPTPRRRPASTTASLASPDRS